MLMNSRKDDLGGLGMIAWRELIAFLVDETIRLWHGKRY